MDKLRALRDLQAELYKKEGYTGILPELYLTDEPNSFAVDGKDGETRKIFISLNDLKRGNSSALLYAHENAHLVKYDKGEEIAKYAETKIGENINKFTEKEQKEYLSSLRKKIEIDKTLEEQFRLARSIPISKRENHTIEYFITAGGGTDKLGFAKASITKSKYTSYDLKNDKVTQYNAATKSFGIGSNDFGGAIGVGFYISDNPEEILKLDKSYGGSISIHGISIGLDILSKNKSNLSYFSDFLNPRGIRIYIGKSTSDLEFHATTIDIGNLEIKKETSILEYYKNEFLPTSIKTYYNNYYNGGEKDR